MKLSPLQHVDLCLMYLTNGICYHDERNVTMLALKRRELVEFVRRCKYGRDHWCLTERGTAEAAKRIAAARRKEITVIYPGQGTTA